MSPMWLLATAIAAVAGTQADKPNFLVIFVDDMGLDQIEVPASQRAYSMTGNNFTIKTPNVKRLASEGLVFQNWYSAYHICSPSRAAMMTGRLPIRSGCVPAVFYADAVGGLPGNETTLAEALLPHGYRTMAIGKWHLGQRPQFLPTRRGFQSYFGIPFSQDMGTSWWENCAGRGNTSEPCSPVPTRGKGGGRPSPLPLFANETIVDQPAGLYTLAARYADAATAFFRDSADRGEPFFLYLPFNHIHGPNSCSAATCGKSVRGPVGDATEDMDIAVGTVMAAIRADLRLATNTLVFFTSDNGSPQRPDGNLPLRGYKHSIWEGGYREPGIAWWPGKVKAGALNREALVATYDIFPTLLSLAGGAPVTSRPIDGTDLSKLLLSATPETASAHDCIMFYHQPESNLGPVGAAALTSLAAVRCGAYKVYWFIDDVDSDQPLPKGVTPGVQTLQSPVIFDLSTDWSESHPLDPSDDTWAAAKRAALNARLAHLQTLGWAPNQMALGSDIKYAICSDPHSQQSFPQYPNCTMKTSQQFWSNPVCECGNHFRNCTECPTPGPGRPPYVPTNSTDCTYTAGAKYVHRLPGSSGDQQDVSSQGECCRRCYESDTCVVAAWHETDPNRHHCYLHNSAAGASTGQTGVMGCVTSRA